MADFTPESHMLESHVNSNIPWRVALAEFIDNSLDAGAKRVVIEKVTSKILRVQDDGSGVEDIVAMFRFGAHRKSGSTKLGRYGVGAKDAWLSCSDVMKVTSVRHHIKTVLDVDYRHLAKNNWQGKDPVNTPTDMESGTTIELTLRAGKDHPNKSAFESISWVFSPAINSGLQIIWKTGKVAQVIKAAQMPELIDVVDSEFDIDGKDVHIRIGILPEGVALSNGPFWLSYGHRVIQETRIGIPKGKSGRRLGGTITLGDSWKLSRNKDSITENLDRLEEAIGVRIQGLVEKASSLSESLQLESLRLKVEVELNAAMSHAREKRPGKQKAKGPSEPKATGRKRTTATVVNDHEDGSVVSKIGPGKSKSGSSDLLQIDFYMDTDDKLGKVDWLMKCVSLNLANPFVQSITKEDNSHAVAMAVLSLYGSHICQHRDNGQKVLAFEVKDFPSTTGKLIANWKGGVDDKAEAI